MPNFLPTLTMPDDLPAPVKITSLMGGVQAIWRFPNGRGASVVNHRGSHGTELAVLRFTGEGYKDRSLDYSTPLTDDVIGHITGPDELMILLRQIRDLPPAREHEGTGEASGAGSGYSPFAAIESLRRMES